MATKVYYNISQLVTNSGVHRNGGLCRSEEDLGLIENAALVLSTGGKIQWFGKTENLPKKYLKASKKNLQGKTVAPSLVDCHTHLVHGGSRFDELALRLEGKTYQEIASMGGGIVKSVTSTRAATHKELFKSAKERIEHMINLGVGIIEMKSGYGLDWATEKKCLEVAQELKKHYKNKLIIKTTFLGAHAFPPGCKTDKDKDLYVQSIVKEMIPEVAKKKLADSCDVFFDEGYFNEKQSELILTTAKRHGLEIKLHADELANVKAAHLAAKLKALSADHLLRADLEGLKAMAKADVVAVLLPTTALYLNIPYASMKAIRESKVVPALASDYNPGSSPTFHMPFVMSLACLQMGMRMDEAMAAATYGGAKALGLESDNGHLAVGLSPKISVYSCPDYRHLIGQVAHPSVGTLL